MIERHGFVSVLLAAIVIVAALCALGCEPEMPPPPAEEEVPVDPPVESAPDPVEPVEPEPAEPEPAEPEPAEPEPAPESDDAELPPVQAKPADDCC